MKTLEIGQIWRYENREGETASRATILKIESAATETIVHVAVSGVRIQNPHTPSGLSDEIGHLPFSETAVLDSLTELESSNNALPDYEEGYEHWKEAFDKGEAGVFSIGIKQAVDYVEHTMNH